MGPAGASFTDRLLAWNSRCAGLCPRRSTLPRETSSPHLWLWIGSEKACPVTAQGIWAFSPEKSVFPGFLRTGAHPAPGLGVQHGRGGAMDSSPGRRRVGPYQPGFAALRSRRQDHPCTAISLDAPGGGSSASTGPPSGMGLVLSGYWKRSIPRTQTNLYPRGGSPGIPQWYREADVGTAPTMHRVTRFCWVIRPPGQMFRKPGIWPLPPRLAWVYEVSLKRAGVIPP